MNSDEFNLQHHYIWYDLAHGKGETIHEIQAMALYGINDLYIAPEKDLLIKHINEYDGQNVQEQSAQFCKQNQQQAVDKSQQKQQNDKKKQDYNKKQFSDDEDGNDDDGSQGIWLSDSDQDEPLNNINKSKQQQSQQKINEKTKDQQDPEEIKDPLLSNKESQILKQSNENKEAEQNKQQKTQFKKSHKKYCILILSSKVVEQVVSSLLLEHKNVYNRVLVFTSLFTIKNLKNKNGHVYAYTASENDLKNEALKLQKQIRNCNYEKAEKIAEVKKNPQPQNPEIPKPAPASAGSGIHEQKKPDQSPKNTKKPEQKPSNNPGFNTYKKKKMFENVFNDDFFFKKPPPHSFFSGFFFPKYNKDHIPLRYLLDCYGKFADCIYLYKFVYENRPKKSNCSYNPLDSPPLDWQILDAPKYSSPRIDHLEVLYGKFFNNNYLYDYDKHCVKNKRMMWEYDVFDLIDQLQVTVNIDVTQPSKFKSFFFDLSMSAQKKKDYKYYLVPNLFVDAFMKEDSKKPIMPKDQCYEILDRMHLILSWWPKHYRQKIITALRKKKQIYYENVKTQMQQLQSQFGPQNCSNPIDLIDEQLTYFQLKYLLQKIAALQLWVQGIRWKQTCQFQNRNPNMISGLGHMVHKDPVDFYTFLIQDMKLRRMTQEQKKQSRLEVQEYIQKHHPHFNSQQCSPYQPVTLTQKKILLSKQVLIHAQKTNSEMQKQFSKYLRQFVGSKQKIDAQKDRMWKLDSHIGSYKIKKKKEQLEQIQLKCEEDMFGYYSLYDICLKNHDKVPSIYVGKHWPKQVHCSIPPQPKPQPIFDLPPKQEKIIRQKKQQGSPKKNIILKVLWIDENKAQNKLLIPKIKSSLLKVHQFSKTSECIQYMQQKKPKKKSNLKYIVIFANKMAKSVFDELYLGSQQMKSDKKAALNEDIIHYMIYCGNQNVAHKICDSHGASGKIFITSIPNKLCDTIQMYAQNYQQKLIS